MKLSQYQLQELEQVASKAAVSAGRYIQSQFDQHYHTQHKANAHSLASQVVTEVDIKAQEIILSYLNDSIRDFDLGLLTEECTDDASRLEKDYFWCIDPMDGTLSFTEHRTGYAVSIALISKDGYPVIGVVNVPDLNHHYRSVRGEGVYLNDQPFSRPTPVKSNELTVYMDRHPQYERYFDPIAKELASYTSQNDLKLIYHAGFGAVRNALGVMNTNMACYFKLPKPTQGSGSIWDYAATYLFFEELGLPVCNASGTPLNLNSPDTTFMNRVGALYATHQQITDLIVGFNFR